MFQKQSSFLLIVLGAALWIASATDAQMGMGNAMQMAQVRQTLDADLEPVLINDRLFRLEVAATPSQWDRGLMGRQRLESDGGMIFVYPYPQLQSFWMANCLIDIDILFLDSKGRIVAVHEMKAEPLRTRSESETAYHARLRRYTSGRPAQFAIELQAGSIEELELQRGDVVHFDRMRLVRMAR